MALVPATTVTGAFNEGSPLNQADVAADRYVDTETGSIYRIRSDGGGLVYDGQVDAGELDRIRSKTSFENLFEPTEQERELQDLQLMILKKQLALQEAAFAKEEERERIFASIYGKPLAEAEAEQAALMFKLSGKLGERQLKALAGELPVSQATERELGKQEETLREDLARDLGPGYATSSAGIARLGRSQEGANIVREAERRGVIAEGTGPIVAAQTQSRNLLARSPYQQPSALGDLLAGERSDRLLKAQYQLGQQQADVDLANALRRPGGGGGGTDYGGIGAGVGAGLGAILGGVWNFGLGAPAGAALGAGLGGGLGRAAGGYYASRRYGRSY